MSESFKTRRETIETTSNVPWSPKKQRMRTIRKGEKSKTEEIAENGKIKKSKIVVAITELKENDSAKVIRVNDDVKNLLSYITKIGMTLGKEITIKDKLY